MPRKRVNGTHRGQAAEVGVVARLVDRAFDDPAMSGGLFVLTLTVMAIVSNAMFLQPASHPRPLFQTRSVSAVPVSAPVSAPRDAANGVTLGGAVEVPLPRVRDQDPLAAIASDTTGSVPASPAPAPAADPQKEMVIAVQRELARLGLYSDAIDGIVGSRTRAAIRNYQAAANLAVTGEPSRELLDLLTTPAPPVTLKPEAAAPPPSLDIEKLERQAAAVADEVRYRRVQEALNKIGYGPLGVDGTAGPDTVNAIRRFQLDNGLAISGTANQALESRLVAIGALDPA